MDKDQPSPLPPDQSNKRSPEGEEDGAADETVDYGWAIPGVEREEALEALQPLDTESAFIKQIETDLVRTLDQLQPKVLEGLSDGALIDLARMLQQVSNIAEFKNIEAARQIQVREESVEPLSSLMGAKNEVQLLQDITHLGRFEAKRRLHLARRAASHTLGLLTVKAEYPHVQQALKMGLISAQGATQVARTLDKAEVSNPELLDMAERSMVEASTGDDFGSGLEVPFALSDDPLRSACAAWEQALRPDGSLPREETAETKRSLHIGAKTAEGLVRITGMVNPEVAAALARLFDAINNPAAAESHPEAATDAEGKEIHDERTAAQKRHDAFAKIVDVAARSSDIPQLGGAAITVMIKTRLEDLHDPKAPAWLLDHNGMFAPVHTSVARHAICAGTTHTYIRTGSGQVEQLSSGQRVFNSVQRKAILVRDGGCVIPGCTVPATWCEIHHVTPHHQGGPTRVENGVALCWHHHRTLGATGWEVRTTKDEVQVRPPPGYAQVWYSHRPRHKPPPKR